MRDLNVKVILVLVVIWIQKKYLKKLIVLNGIAFLKHTILNKEYIKDYNIMNSFLRAFLFPLRNVKKIRPYLNGG